MYSIPRFKQNSKKAFHNSSFILLANGEAGIENRVASAMERLLLGSNASTSRNLSISIGPWRRSRIRIVPLAFPASSSANKIVKISTNGASSFFSVTGQALKYPAGLGFDGAGNLYVANNGNNSVLRIGTNGVATTFASSFLNKPFGLAVDNSGIVYVSNLGNSTISKFATNGAGSIALATGLNAPYGITLDAPGNLYIANSGANNIIKVSPAGVSSVLAVTNSPIVNPVTVSIGN